MYSDLVRARVHAAAAEALGPRQSDRKLMKKTKEEVRQGGVTVTCHSLRFCRTP